MALYSEAVGILEPAAASGKTNSRNKNGLSSNEPVSPNIDGKQSVS